MLKIDVIKEGGTGRASIKMSFPAMISNEPPPIDSDEEDGEDVDDEFRSNGLHLDVSADPSPMSSPRKSALGSSSNNHKVSPLVLNSTSTPPVELTVSSASLENNGVESHSVEDMSSNNSSVLVNEEEDGDEDFGDFATTCTEPGSRDSPVTAITKDSSQLYEIPSLVNGTCSKSDDEQLECPDFKLSGDEEEEKHWKVQHTEFESPKAQHVQTQDEIDDDDFGDFGDFTASEPIVTPPIIPVEQPVSDFHASFPSCEDSEPFSEVKVEPQPLGIKSFSPVTDLAEEEEDDFGDFASSDAKESLETVSRPPCSVPQPPSVPLPSQAQAIRRESIQLEGKLDALIKSVFNQPTLSWSVSDETQLSRLEPIDEQLGNSASNSTWTHVQEFEDSNCLLHKWPRSGVHHLLLNSLHIDYSNIVYSAKYGTIQVPKFASSLVDSPLLPESVAPTRRSFDYPPEVDEGMRIERLDDYSPDADVSPVTELTPPVSSHTPMNKEAIRILEQLPDLSYMLAKTLVFPRHPNY